MGSIDGYVFTTDIMWFQIDNNSQHVSKPVCLAVVYISPEGSSRPRGGGGVLP